MKKLIGLFLICLLISGCAGFHMSWVMKHKDIVAPLFTLHDNLITTDNTVNIPDNTPPNANDSTLLRFTKFCNDLANTLRNESSLKDLTIAQKDSIINDLANKIKANQADIDKLIHQPKKVETIVQHDLKEVMNPKNEELQKQCDSQVVQIAKQAVWNSIWRWAAIIGWSLIILALFLKFYFKKI